MASLGGGGGPPPPVLIQDCVIQGVHPRIKLIFLVAEFTDNTGQTTTWEGGEGGNGDETTAKKRESVFRGR